MKIDSFTYNPQVEDIVNVLVNKTQNYNKDFFRLQTNFYLTLVPSSLGIKINCPITGTIPINFYGINLAHSGSGKGYSTTFLENTLLKKFRKEFLQKVYPNQTKLSLDSEAVNRAAAIGCTHQKAVEKLEKEFNSYGAYKFTFDSATSPAIKQFRHKILLGKLGSLNFIMDELGANLKSNLEPLYTFLELFDKGLIKDKLTKSTVDSVRHNELTGSTPANLLLFGTPSKLLDGASIENEFFDLLEMGYARRCFFANSVKESKITELSTEELYDLIENPVQEGVVKQFADILKHKANVNICNLELKTPKSVGLKLLKYRQICTAEAEKLPEHQEILKSELTHRYFKALKLAGTYAFLDGLIEITETHLYQAIKFAEDSGKALKEILNRKKPYERLAEFISSHKGKTFTSVDLMEELPYYKGTLAQKKELFSLASAWGYTHNIVLKSTISDGIEFFSGDSLTETDLTKIRVAYSQHFADGYINAEIDWEKDIETLMTQDSYHWINHHSINGKRRSDCIEEGFNLIVLDIDGGTTLSEFKILFNDFEYFIYTTKRHQKVDPETGKSNDRFRVVLPMSHELRLNEEDYRAFMENFTTWCPFTLDTQTFQRSRKWACYANGSTYRNKGKLLDVLQFIPKTAKESVFNNEFKSLESLTKLEQWFAYQIKQGNRNNYLLRYSFVLKDSGLSLFDVQTKILEFNKKLPNPLSQSEIESTIFNTLSQKYEEM